MNPASVQDMLRDAQILAQHAVRRGKLPANSKVFELMSSLRASPDPASEAEMVAQLYREIDALAKAIAPTTFKQLVWRQSLSGYVRHFFAVTTPYALGFLTLLLTLYLAFQSSQLHQADTALRAYEDWVGQQPREKLFAAFKMYRYERVLNIRQPPLAQLDAYQRLIEDAHQLAAKGNAIQELLQSASAYRYFPPFLHASPLASYAGLIRQEGATAGGTIDLKPGVGTNPDIPGSGPVMAGPGPDAGRLGCAVDEPQAPVGLQRHTQLQPSSDMEAYASSWACFLSLLAIDEQRLSYSPWPVIFATRLKVNMLVTWLLPALYGLLGACVYLMRNMMVTRHEEHEGDQKVLTHFSL
ncbi:MAG: hypothetical protein JWQ33_504, partial [Ramlibacter sp.]|nr:hypothetical protein [Ramlibacter sp.]